MALAVAVINLILWLGAVLSAVIGLHRVNERIREQWNRASRALDTHRAQLQKSMNDNVEKVTQVAQELERTRDKMVADFGRLLMIDGKVDEAVELLSEVIARNPDDMGARWRRGQCYERQNDWPSALEDYTSGLKSPLPSWLGRGEANLFLGRALLKLRKHTDASAPLKVATESPDVSDKVEALNLLGSAYRLSGEVENALATYEQCLHRSPRDAVAAVGKAYTLADRADRGSGDPAEALTWLAERLSTHPEGKANYLLARADIYLRRGEIKNAVKDLDASVRINPRGTRPYEIKGTLLVRSAQEAQLGGDGSKAVELAALAVETLGKGLEVAMGYYKPVFHNLRVQAYLLLGEVDKAVTEGRLSVERNYAYYQNHAALLMALAWNKDWPGLIEAADRSLALEQVVQSRNGATWVRFYYLVGLLCRDGLTDNTRPLCLEFLNELPHAFSPALFEFWPVVKQHLVSGTVPPARTLIQSFEDKTVAAKFWSDLGTKAQALSQG
ncbi:MAG: tetratricopeptide repeat protein [Chloroflexota bacterium]|nr:tetratricopeptide repeat protein [Chloroflexota bacterium]